MWTRREISFALKKLKIYPRKSLGQNFLVSKNLSQKIVQQCNINKGDFVIEIGPGLGSLTYFLLEQAGNVFAIEIDKKLYNFLLERFGHHSHLILVCDDALNISKYTSYLTSGNMKLVSTLPYASYYKILLCYIKLPISEFYISLQKEVHTKISARTIKEEVSALGVIIQQFFEIKKILKIKKELFYPVPKSDSVFLKLTRKPDAKIPDNIDKIEKILGIFIHNSRRKIRTVCRHYSIEIEQIPNYRINNFTSQEIFAISEKIANRLC